MSIASEIARISGNISDSLTAVSNKGVTIPTGSNSDDLAGLIAQISGGSISITDEPNATGTTLVVTGDGSSGGTLITKVITLNGTYDPDDDNADGYSSVTVNVNNGASTSQVQNIYGTEVVITSASGAAPSATAHTIYYEFIDGTNTTITAYWDDAFISNAITTTTPTTYDSKVVTLAQLDGVTWYSYSPSTETWETIFDGQANTIADTPYPYFWISSLSDVSITEGSVWKITINNDVYRCTAFDSNGMYGIIIGNGGFTDTTYVYDGVGEPFYFSNPGWGAWTGSADLIGETTYNLKFERLVEE